MSRCARISSISGFVDCFAHKEEAVEMFELIVSLPVAMMFFGRVESRGTEKGLYWTPVR